LLTGAQPVYRVSMIWSAFTVRGKENITKLYYGILLETESKGCY
jgi:hypothetical protein